MTTKVFWCEATDECDYFFRRYSDGVRDCPSPYKYHDAQAFWYRGARIPAGEGGQYFGTPEAPADAAWPTICKACPRPFSDEESRQVFIEPVYRRVDNGDLFHWRDAPVGAMTDAWWLGDHWAGDDGIHLMVKLIGDHDWLVDGPCSNCTRKGEQHYCWVRHGDPRTGNIHVDKNGNTCAAGAGSIAIPGYHGFLHDGVLTDG